MNGYICLYKGKRIEVYADTTLQAQTIAAKQLKARKAYEVTVGLAEKDVVCVLTGVEGENADDCTTHEHESGTQVVHTAVD